MSAVGSWVPSSLPLRSGPPVTSQRSQVPQERMCLPQRHHHHNHQGWQSSSRQLRGAVLGFGIAAVARKSRDNVQHEAVRIMDRLKHDSEEGKQDFADDLRTMLWEADRLGAAVQQEESCIIEAVVGTPPADESDSISEDVTQRSPRMLIDILEQSKSVRGIVDEVRRRLPDAGWLVLLVVQTDCGLLFGSGHAEEYYLARELAAYQVTQRISKVVDPLAAIRQAATELAGAQTAQGVEAIKSLEVLSHHLKDLSLLVGEPAASGMWRASLSANEGQEAETGVSSLAPSKQEAIFQAAEQLWKRLSASSNVSDDGGGGSLERVKRIITAKHGSDLTVEPLGGSIDSQQALEEALMVSGGEEWTKALSRLRTRMVRSRQRSSKAEQRYNARAAKDAKVLQRCFEVTPAMYDSRRPEIVGSLPAEQLRVDIGQALESSQVVIVTGGTGSGKSTQIPQFLLDDWRYVGPGTVSRNRIVVTQPRRIAAISIAERVAWERDQSVGQQVGYSVRGQSNRPTSDGSSVEFCSVGTLLRRTLRDKRLDHYDVVVMDEVHERDLLTDFLLTLLREVLPGRPGLRLVLMSATLDVDTFQNYFSDVPIVSVPAKPRYPVEEVYLDDDFFKQFAETEVVREMEEEGRAFMEEDDAAESDLPEVTDIPQPESPAEPPQLGLTWWGQSKNHNCVIDLMASVVKRLVEMSDSGTDEKLALQGSILCFLPGWPEITAVMRKLQSSERLWLLPLHSALSKEDQSLVFQQPESGKVKVVLATNIAESSITIDDVHTVVDLGLHKELCYDCRTRVSSLVTMWTPKSSAVQRAGRAGRVAAGQVLRLYSRQQLEVLPWRGPPEMQRCHLADSCLSCVVLGRNPRVFLADAPSPPGEVAIEVAMNELTSINAVTPNDPPHLLPVGEVLSRLPMEPLLGRALILGSLLGMTTLAAGVLAVSSAPRSLFTNKPDLREEARAKQKEFCSWSDSFSGLEALLRWEKIYAAEGSGAAKRWATENRLIPGRLWSCWKLKQGILMDAKRAGLMLVDTSSAADAALNIAEESSVFEMRETLGEEMDLELQAAEPGFSEDPAGLDSEDMQLLAGVVCFAYPSNVAVGVQESARHRTKDVPFALIARNSVNTLSKKMVKTNTSALQGPRWYCYGSMRLVGTKGFMSSTTKLADWQIALFSGMDVQASAAEGKEAEQHSFQVDGWLNLRGVMPGTCSLVLALRREIDEALSWTSLLARRRSVKARAAVHRAQILFTVLRQILSGQAADESALKALRNCQVPENRIQAPAARPSQTPRQPLERQRVKQLVDEQLSERDAVTLES